MWGAGTFAIITLAGAAGGLAANATAPKAPLLSDGIGECVVFIILIIVLHNLTFVISGSWYRHRCV